MAQLAVAAVMFVGSVYKGRQQQKLKEREAIAYEDARDRRVAAMTREIAEERRRKEFMYSRGLAVAGAQGATQADPGIHALLSDLNAEGEYRMLSVMWTGLDEAQALRYRADAARREGQAAWEAGIVSGITSAVSSYVTMGGGTQPFGKFGTSEQMRLGQRAAEAERLSKFGQVWDASTGQWVELGVNIPSYQRRGL